jgi:hypothetical protein
MKTAPSGGDATLGIKTMATGGTLREIKEIPENMTLVGRLAPHMEDPR